MSYGSDRKVKHQSSPRQHFETNKKKKEFTVTLHSCSANSTLQSFKKERKLLIISSQVATVQKPEAQKKRRKMINITNRLLVLSRKREKVWKSHKEVDFEPSLTC